MTGTVANVSTTVTANLIDEITIIAGPIVATMIGIDVIIVATTAAMTDTTTTVAMTVTTGVMTTGVIVVMIATMTNATTDEMTDVASTTTITTTTTGRNELHRHRPKGATPMVCFRRPTARSTSSSEVAKRSKATGRPGQMPGRLGMSTLRTRGLCVGLNSQSLSLGKIVGFTSLTTGLTHSLLTP
jgi:hypothetical protein